MRQALKSIFLLTNLLLLAACTSPTTPDFSGMSAKYANILEQYQINGIFHNVMRAASHRPLSFLDMPTITGSGSVSTTPSLMANYGGLSYSSLGVTLGALTPSVATTFGNSFNFTQSSLDNATFWKGFLSELPGESIKYFYHNHIPREVLFSLVIDEIVITKPNSQPQRYINNPLRPDHQVFQAELYKLLRSGLAPRLIKQAENIDLPMTVADLKKSYGKDYANTLQQKGIQLKLISKKSEPLYQQVKYEPVYRWCVNQDEYENFVRQTFETGMNCEQSFSQEKPVLQAGDKPELNIVLRSTRNIYDYLGAVVRAQLADKSYLVSLPPSDSTFDEARGQTNDYALLVIQKGKPSGRTFATIETLDPEWYSIPLQNNGYSQLVIDLLAQLITLQKIPGSIPASPAVLIK